MRRLHLYIVCALLISTQAILAQQVEWGSYARKQAGLQLKLKGIAAGSGLQVILSTANEDEPAWVPDKGKGCKMILSDASKLAGCKVIQSPGLKNLTFTSKDPNNISTASLQYIFDLEPCMGSHEILINYSVVCKKGEGKKGQIKIPFSVKLPPKTSDPIVSQEPSDPKKEPDTTATQASNPPDEDKSVSENPITNTQPRTQTTDPENPFPPDPTDQNSNPDSNTDTEPQVTEAIATTASTSANSPQKKPEETPPPPPQKSACPYCWILILLILGAIGWYIYARNKKQAPPPLPVRQRQPSASPMRKQPTIGLKAMPRPHKSGSYTIVNLQHCWEDSSIHQVYLNDQLMQELNDFITDQNLRPFHEDGVDAVPEIGGFILGQYKHAQKEGEWDVYLEKFTPITPGKSGVYRVSFETMAWAELAEVQDQYPAFQTLAWFHTHPGHGLFLSQPDLRIHNGFFKEKYQLAMEIDTMSEGLDTAFFSRKKSGEVNNRKDRASNRWFKWNQLMKIQQAHD